MARPLTKKKKNGDLYVRHASIETKIDVALGQDCDTIRRRTRSTDPLSPDFLPSTCLVHLIRDAICRKDDRLASVLLPSLLARCEANLMKTVPDGGMRNAEAVREGILSDLMLMFTEDGTPGHEYELDFFECSFRRAFRALRIDRVRKELTQRKALQELPESPNDDSNSAFDDSELARLSRMAQIGAAQEDSVYLQQVLKAVRKMPNDERKAVVLCRLLGYDEESGDASKHTAATICKVEGRTIRNRLSRANKLLKNLKEDR